MKNKHLPTEVDESSSSPASSAKRRAKFTDEFKRMAVARLRQEGQNGTVLAIELGIRRNLLYKWAKKIDEQGPKRHGVSATKRTRVDA